MSPLQYQSSLSHLFLPFYISFFLFYRLVVDQWILPGNKSQSTGLPNYFRDPFLNIVLISYELHIFWILLVRLLTLDRQTVANFRVFDPLSFDPDFLKPMLGSLGSCCDGGCLLNYSFLFLYTSVSLLMVFARCCRQRTTLLFTLHERWLLKISLPDQFVCLGFIAYQTL